MSDHRPKRVMSGQLEKAGKRGPGRKEKECTDCVAENRQVFGITKDWSTARLFPILLAEKRAEKKSISRSRFKKKGINQI